MSEHDNRDDQEIEKVKDAEVQVEDRKSVV